MRKRILRGIGLAGVMALMLATASNTYATNEIDEAKKEKEEMEANLKDTQSALENLESLKSNSEAYIKKMDEYLGNLTNHMYELNQQAVAKQAEIDAKQAEISDMEQQIAEQYADMKLRIQYMYENGEVSYISMFFESQDMSDFLNRAEYLTDITEYDRKMMDKLQDSKDMLKLAKADLDDQLEALNGLIAENKEEQAAVEVLLAAKEKELDSTNSDIYTKEQAIIKQQEEIRQQEALIKELEEIERRRQEEAKKNKVQLTYDGGKLIWPLNGYSRISSEFGPRVHPITGIPHTHSGIDIPAPLGTEIHAAYGGQVAWAYYNQSAGNWIGIDHGNGFYTIYMHMSRFLVSEGDMVKQGDVIGLVGSTGNSTGPHLHFSVRVNGSYVQPLNYVQPN